MTDVDLTGDWYGWRLRGRHFVSPDGQRITQERLHGLLWRDAMELRRAGYASRRKAETGSTRRQIVKVIVVDLAHFQLHGSFAG